MATTRRHRRSRRAPRRSFGRAALPYLLSPAGAAGLHRHPDAVRHRRLVLAAALQHEPADACAASSGSSSTSSCSRAARSGTRSGSRCSTPLLTVGVELLLGLGIALLLRRSTWLNNALSIALLLPLMVAPAIAALMWKLMTHPDFGILSYLLGLFGITDFRWASAPSQRSVHRHPGRRLGLHAVHHDPAAGRPALAAAPAVRGGRARRRAGELRVLPHHPADADALHHHRGPVPDARQHPAVRHRLRHDPGRPRQRARCCSRSRPISTSSRTSTSAARPRC